MKIRIFKLLMIGRIRSKSRVKETFNGLKQGMTLLVLVIIILGTLLGVTAKGWAADHSEDFPSLNSFAAKAQTQQPTDKGDEGFWRSSDIAKKVIRFHVVANSDSEADQALKLAVRDAILVKVSPGLAKSQSLEESRLLLQSLQPEMESIARSVVQAWGKNEQIRSDYGRFQFPTKSYGSIVLPAGEYEAVRILIGQAEGANWWCVLFPPLCFVDIEHSTAVPVDGKPAVPLQKGAYSEVLKVQDSSTKDVRFWFWEKALELIRNS